MSIRDRIEADILEENRLAKWARYHDRMQAAMALPWKAEPAAFDGHVAGPGPQVLTPAAFVAAAHYEAGNGPFDGEDPIIGEAVFEHPDYLNEQAKASVYLGLCKAETGLSIPDDVLAKRRRQWTELKAQTREIAYTLEAGGFPCFRNTPFALYHFYVHTGFFEQIPMFRRVIILPYVAAMVRAPMLAAVESFIERHPFSRFWTFTSGLRCNVLSVRTRVKKLHRRISALNSQPFMKAAGLEIVFRSTELGTPEIRASGLFDGNSGAVEIEDGKPYFHPHVHCVVNLRKGYISATKWEGILKQVWAFWKNHWDEGRAIGDARECLKYVTKPGEMLKLAPQDLCELARQLRRLKLAQPMGTLADEIKARHASCKKLVRAQTPDGPVFREMIDWNRLRPSSEDEKHRAAAERLSPHDSRPCTRVLARLLPAIGPAGVKEPRAIIMTNEPLDAALLRRHPAIAPMIAASIDEFLAGVRIRVHTCTPTVLPGLDPGQLSAWAEAPPATISEFFVKIP